MALPPRVVFFLEYVYYLLRVLVRIAFYAGAWAWQRTLFYVMNRQPRFLGKTIWITGASSGIGEALAVRFAQLKAKHLILSSRNVSELERVKQLCGDGLKVTVLPMDMNKPQEVMQITARFVKELEKVGDSVDMLVLNAGLTQRTPFVEFDYENHDYITTVNYVSPTAHTKALLPHLMKNPGSQIVVMNSISGKRPMPMRSSYCGSKAALVGFFDVLRAEVAPYNVQITQIYPGPTQTDVAKNALCAQKGQRFGKTDPSIAKGMPLKECVDEIIVSIFLKDKDRTVALKASYYVDMQFQDVWPEVFHDYTQKDVLAQFKQIQEAK